MAKPLVFLFGDQEIPLQLGKVDRGKLYGSKDTEAVDDQDQVCELATLADDGRTLIGRGGTGLGWLDADGKWCDKAQLNPHNVDGDPIEPVKSSFGAPIKLFDNASVEDVLDHSIRLVYQLRFDGPGESEASAQNIDDLMVELKRGTIFKFPYSYRGGLEADVAFLLSNEEDELMLLVGNPTEVAFVGIQSQVTVDDSEAAGDDGGGLMDFDMI